MERAMEIVKVIDYAPYLDEIKRLVRETYELSNERRFKEAEEVALQLVVEAKLLLNAIRHNG
jgi:hypothetical protein